MNKLIGVVSVLASLMAVGLPMAGEAFQALSRLSRTERAALTVLPDDLLASFVSVPPAAATGAAPAEVRAPEPPSASPSRPTVAGSDRPSLSSGVPAKETPPRLESPKSEPTRSQPALSTAPRDVETLSDPARADVAPTAAPHDPVGAIVLPRPARERDASEDPGAIIDWLLRERRR
jgi:hypothetical protein